MATPLLFPLLLLLLLRPAESGAGNASAAFRSVRACPSVAGTPANLTGLKYERACAVECAARPDCAAAAHSQSEAACRLAGAAEFARGWRSSPDCHSEVSADRLVAGGLAASALTAGTRAALLVFHNFLLGTPNLAGGSNRSFAASLGTGARLTDSGVWLDGGAASYIEIDTEAGNLTQNLGYGRQFTYFAKYRRAWQPGQTAVYIQQFTKGDYSVSGGKWSEYRGTGDSVAMLSIEAQFASSAVKPSNSASNLLPIGDTIPIFVAATFNGTVFNQLNWNGTFYPGTSLVSSYNYTSDWNGKLRLGVYNYGTDWNMRGYFICWGAAAGMLTSVQLQEINSLC